MQAIITTYLCPTNTKGTRYKASCEAGSITVSADDALNIDQNHIAACQALKDKLSKRNATRYGTKPEHDVWQRQTVCGSFDGAKHMAHVFVD
jgi:hypothetical protein